MIYAINLTLPQQFTQYARAKPNMEYNALMGLLIRQEGLLDSFQRLAGNKAPGVDGLKKVDYAIGLENRFRDLSSRILLSSLIYAFVKDSGWEPDGRKVQVRFCEGDTG